MLEQILAILNKVRLWHVSLFFALVLLGFGFTGRSVVSENEIIEGKEELAIIMGVVFFVATLLLRYFPPPEDKQ